ncbi:MAG TPA: hypothetical protein P5248_05595, partial [Bacteroidales bacterium]|nr:hypothetical protein [Bacteroidales bacterium]
RITSDLREDHAETSVEEAIVTGPDRKVTLMLRDDDTTLMRDDDTYSYFLFDEEARLPIVRDGSSYTGMAELEIHPTRDSAATIQVVREALGASRKNATQNTLQIPYHVQCDSGKCVIAGTFTFNSPEGWRNQRLRYVVRLPESYILEINKNSKQILTVPEEFKPSSPLLLINSNGRIRSMRTDNPKAASEPHGGHTLEMM